MGGGGGGGAASGYNIPQPQYSGVADATAATGITQLEQQGTGLQGLFNTYGVNTTPYEVPLPAQPVRSPLGVANWQQGAGFGGSAGTLGTSAGGKTGTTGSGSGTGGSVLNMIPGLSSGTGANTSGAGTVGTGTATIPGASSGGIDLSSLSSLANELGALFPTYQTTLGPGGQTSGGLVNLLQPTNYTSQQGVNAGNAVQASVLGLPNLASSLTQYMNAGQNTFNQGQPAFQNALTGAMGAANNMGGSAQNIGTQAANLTGIGNEINSQVPGAQANANAMSSYVPQALAQGFDPNQALYTQDLQATMDASMAQQAASGTATSPFGSMATGRAVSEFENAWNQQQVGLESTAANTANTLLAGQNIPAGLATQAGTAYNQAGSLYGQQGALYGQQGQAYGQIPTMLTANQANQQTAQQTSATTAGTIESLLSQFSSGMLGGSSTAQDSANNVLNALSGLTGVGNQASAQQQMAVGDSISYLQTAIQAAEALTQAQQAEQQMGQQSAGMAGQALGSLGGMMGGK